MADHWRYRNPEPGMKGWLRTSHNYTPAWTAIEVLAVNRDTTTAIIRVGRGGEKRVFFHHLDCGREFQTGRGEWIPESDPRVRAWLAKAVADIRVGGKKVCQSDDLLVRADAVRDLEWVMRRNGWGTP